MEYRLYPNLGVYKFEAIKELETANQILENHYNKDLEILANIELLNNINLSEIKETLFNNYKTALDLVGKTDMRNRRGTICPPPVIEVSNEKLWIGLGILGLYIIFFIDLILNI